MWLLLSILLKICWWLGVIILFLWLNIECETLWNNQSSIKILKYKYKHVYIYIYKHCSYINNDDSDVLRSKDGVFKCSLINTSVKQLGHAHVWISDGFYSVDNWNILDQNCVLEETGCLPAELLRDVSWRPVTQGWNCGSCEACWPAPTCPNHLLRQAFASSTAMNGEATNINQYQPISANINQYQLISTNIH